MADAKSANGTGSDKRTVVEDGTLFKGALSSTCPIIVKGRIEGELSAPSLTVSNSGAVHGTVKVGELRSEGELAGEFDADMVQLSGRVRDNTVIRARSLEVKLAPPEGKMQVIFGECALEVGDAPSKEATAGGARAESPPVRTSTPAPSAPSVPPPSATPSEARAASTSVAPPGDAIAASGEESEARRASRRPAAGDGVASDPMRRADTLPPVGADDGSDGRRG